MDTISAIVALLTTAPQITGGVESVFNLIAVFKAGGALTTDQVQQIRMDGAMEDALFNQHIADAEKRLDGT